MTSTLSKNPKLEPRDTPGSKNTKFSYLLTLRIQNTKKMYGTRNPDGIQFEKARVLGNTNTNTISNTILSENGRTPQNPNDRTQGSATNLEGKIKINSHFK